MTDPGREQEAYETLVEGILAQDADETEGEEEEIEPDVVLFIVVLMTNDSGEREAGAVLLPEDDNQLSSRLKSLISDEWIDNAPLGVYTYRYDYEAAVSAMPDDADQFIFYQGPGDEEGHGKKLGELLANDLIIAGSVLYNMFATVPEEEELIAQFDKEVNEAIVRAARTNITRFCAGSVRLMVLPKGKEKGPIDEAKKEGALKVMCFSVPTENFPFFTHFKMCLEDYFQRVLEGREEIVVRARVRQLWRERGKITTSKKMRARIDEQIDHLCLVFGIDEETATQHTSWNLGLSPEDLETLDEPPVNIPGLMPTIEAK